MTIKQARSWIPVLGFLALAALFLNLPGAPNILGLLHCKTCSASDPYVPLAGAGYFATLVALSLIFPTFPGPHVARGGLIWAVLLAGSLTYLKLPGWCPTCLVGHTCNILIWLIWLVDRSPATQPITTFGERMCLTLFAPIATVALFSSLNLTFTVYGFRLQNDILATTFQPGDAAPTFSTQTSSGRALDSAAAQSGTMVINFIAPGCPHCEDQLPAFDAVAKQLAKGPYRFVNVTPALIPKMQELATHTEWIEDKGNTLHKLFQVAGTPTLFVVGGDGKIAHIISGVPEQFEAQLLGYLVKPQEGEK